MTTYTVQDDAPEEDGAAATTKLLCTVRIVNAADRGGINYYIPLVGCIEHPSGATLIGMRHGEVSFGLPPHVAVGWALAVARYTLTKTTSANRALRDELIEQAYALIEELGELRTHESASEVMQ